MAGPEAELADSIRHALSWRLKARQLEHGAKDDAQLRVFYGTQAKKADAALNQLRTEGQAFIASEGKRLQKLLAGKASESRVEHCRESITFLNSLLRSEDPEEAGGFVDLPLEEYLATLEGAQPLEDPWAVFSLRGLLVVISSIALGAGLVFLYAALRTGGVYLYIERPPSPSAPVPIILVNESATPVDIHVSPLLDGHDAMYLSVLAQADAGDEFVLLPSLPESWNYPASGAGMQEGISIPPGLRAELQFSTQNLDTVWEGTLRGFRFELRRGNGALVDAKELRWHAQVGIPVTPPATALPAPTAP